MLITAQNWPTFVGLIIGILISVWLFVTLSQIRAATVRSAVALESIKALLEAKAGDGAEG